MALQNTELCFFVLWGFFFLDSKCWMTATFYNKTRVDFFRQLKKIFWLFKLPFLVRAFNRVARTHVLSESLTTSKHSISCLQIRHKEALFLESSWEHCTEENQFNRSFSARRKFGMVEFSQNYN